MLSPYDPIVEVCDRELLVPDKARRQQVWRATANPGTVLAAGEIVGLWRQRKRARSVTVTVSPFDRLTRTQRAAVETNAAALVASDPVEVVFND